MRPVVWLKGYVNGISIVARRGDCGIPQTGVVLHLSGIQRTKPAKGNGCCEGKLPPLSLSNYRKCVRVIREALHTDPHDLGHATRARKPLVSFYQGSPVKDSSRVARCIGVRDRYCPLPGIAIASDGGRLQGTPTFAAALEAVGSVRAAVRCAPDAAGRFPTVGCRSGFSLTIRACRRVGLKPDLQRYLSTIAVTPIPPAVQIEISPRPLPRVASNLASVARMRAPVAANGC